MGSLGSLLPSLQPLRYLPLHCLQGRIVMWPIILSSKRTPGHHVDSFITDALCPHCMSDCLLPDIGMPLSIQPHSIYLETDPMSTCIVATWMKGLSTLTTAARATAAATIGSECFPVSASSAACTTQRLTKQHSSDHQVRPLQTILSTLLRGCHHGWRGRKTPAAHADSNTQAACLFPLLHHIHQ